VGVGVLVGFVVRVGVLVGTSVAVQAAVVREAIRLIESHFAFYVKRLSK
jgi:hypothetical protein